MQRDRQKYGGERGEYGRNGKEKLKRVNGGRPLTRQVGAFMRKTCKRSSAS